MNAAGGKAGALLSAVAVALLALALIFSGNPGAVPNETDLHALSGQTMGTSYRILLPASEVSEALKTDLQESVARRLFTLDREIFSTYSSNSSLATLNAAEPGVAMPLGPEMLEVLVAAAVVHERSGGAFDITVKPLVDLWGFGAGDPPAGLPGKTAIDEALVMTGMDKLVLDPGAGTLERKQPVMLDLSAIAKGFAVDEVARLLDAAGVENYLVEIGGEIMVRGKRPDASQWRVGIETPEPGARTLFEELQAGPGAMAIAASGNYRNFFMHEGRRYAHTINPATGWPVSHDLVTVTVVADSAMLADAWATALLVLGPGEGMKLANDLQLAAYFIVTGSTGFSARHSDAFNRYIKAIQ